MPKTLFLLDGMALVYRAHFAFIKRPIFSSKGINTSALYGFTNTLLDLLETHAPTHVAVAFDTEAPTHRHKEYPEYKAHREAMPEDIAFALPHVHELVRAFRIPVLTCDGYEADDIIGTLARASAGQGFTCYMVSPDKDLAQLVTERVWLMRPGRLGEPAEVLKVAEILERWGVERPEQVIDILALMGDASDNIPGVPGVGEKTAAKWIAQYGSVENLLAHTAELKGKQRETLEAHREQALLCKRLATVITDVPLAIELEGLKRQERDEEALRRFCVEFEFNTLGRRLLGDQFKAGRGSVMGVSGQGELGIEVEPARGASQEEGRTGGEAGGAANAGLRTIREVAHAYHLVREPAERAQLLAELHRRSSVCFDTETTSLDAKQARLLGIAFSFGAHEGYYVALPEEAGALAAVLGEFRGWFGDDRIEKVGHNLKYDLSVLKWHGVEVAGRLFDTMLAHSLVEPDQRHGMDYLSEVYLGYTPIPITRLIGEKKGEQRSMAEVAVELVAEYAAEDADVTWQLRSRLEPLLKEKGQEKVFYEIECPLVPVLVDMEFEGVRVDASALVEFSAHLARVMGDLEKRVYRQAGREFNLNSPKQLGEVLFEELRIAGQAKRTRTGQYATDEQTLLALAAEHEVVRAILEYREAAKLKSTYADALPSAIFARTGRVHTTYNQVMTATGRLQSQDPNLQNIPIRTELGQEIRKAFVPRNEQYWLLSADYSQVELRIIGALSGDPGMLEAFASDQDIHAATAARLHGVSLEEVSAEMRRRAKMVNFGILYGISAFGLAQRLGIARTEAAAIIEQYFRQYPKIQSYIQATIEMARSRGYVETVTGRRRYLRDIRSANATVRSAAERTAINTPIQGTAADMIKLAMSRVHRDIGRRRLKTRMLMQVHDELVFDLCRVEEMEVRELVEGHMKNAISLPVPIAVEIGVGKNWLEAH